MIDETEIYSSGGLVRMTPECSLKLIEEPAVYNRETDELYFINHEAAPFLSACAAGALVPRDEESQEFVAYCLEEGILEPAATAAARAFRLRQSPLPSLRYLLLHITDKCNLLCAHCFQAGEDGRVNSLGLGTISAVVDEFESLQGLRLMVSGGEPLLHPDFWQVNDLVAQRDIRSILLTNGLLIDSETAAAIRFNEVQVSIDGVGPSHDRLRGPGTFERAVAAVRTLRAAGKQVSIATMIHAGNVEDFRQLQQLVHDLDVREWSIDLPSPVGRLAANRSLLVEPAVAEPLLNLAYGGAIHEPAPGHACGAHLMAVMTDTTLARCGFYGDSPLGTTSKGLAAAWEKIGRISLDELECDCEHLTQCRGGCRFRASDHGGPYGVDPCQCFRYGVK